MCSGFVCYVEIPVIEILDNATTSVTTLWAKSKER